MPIHNATMAMGGLSAVSSISSILALILTTSLIVGIFIMLAYEPMMRRLLKFVAFLKKTFGLFFYGVGGSIIIGGVYMFAKVNVQQVQSGNPILLKVMIYPIIAYAIMTGFGWIIKTFVVDKVKKSYKKAIKGIK